MRILFGICSWGLGHATRTLPIMRRLVQEGHEITAVSHGNTLNLLRKELGESAGYADLEDYQPPASMNTRALALHTFLSAPQYIFSMRREHRFVEKMVMEGKVDAIFSDNRFGFYSLRVPSFFMTHQLRIMNPLRSKRLESGSERFNKWFLDRFSGVLVPDFKDDGLSGRLAHELAVIDEDRLNYIGVLSDFKYRSLPQDIDVFAAISGFEPSRSAFEKLVLDQLDGFHGKTVVSLGRPAETYFRNGMKVQGLSPRSEQEELLNRAKIVIARSGYSTLMDLYALGKNALLVPTPGQTEQEYLATYHMSLGDYYCVRQRELDIPAQLESVCSRNPPKTQHPTEQAVENAIGVITETAGPG